MEELQGGQIAAEGTGGAQGAEATYELTETQGKEFESGLGGGKGPNETDGKEGYAEESGLWTIEKEEAGEARESEADSPDAPGEGDAAFSAGDKGGGRQPADSGEGDFIERMARSAGMTKEAYMQNAERMADRQKVSGRLDNLRAQGVEQGLAMHIAKTELENAKLRLGLSAGQERRMETAFLQSAQRLEQRWPEVGGLGELPGEVVAALAEGLTPMEAYQQYRLAGMERELRGLRQERKNRAGSTGSVRGSAVNVEDDFVRALMKNY